MVQHASKAHPGLRSLKSFLEIGELSDEEERLEDGYVCLHLSKNGKECGKSFATEAALASHRDDTRHASASYTCRLCGRAFRVSTNYCRHMRRSHPAEYAVDALLAMHVEAATAKTPLVVASPKFKVSNAAVSGKRGRAAVGPDGAEASSRLR